MYKFGLIAAAALALLAGGAFAQSPATNDNTPGTSAAAPTPPNGQWSANADDDHIGKPDTQRAASNGRPATSAGAPATPGSATQTKTVQ
jgi:hypothetical protein